MIRRWHFAATITEEFAIDQVKIIYNEGDTRLVAIHGRQNKTESTPTG